MPETRAQQAAELFKTAIERSEAEWPQFLSSACGGDNSLRAEVESLLRHYREADSFLEQPAVELAADSLVNGATWAPGEELGHYRIDSLIGVGGMGEVYLADDLTLKRKVALKLVQRGMNSAQILRRFRQEEEILASLNHPNIAQLYGTGTSSDGVPFFVMEYVDGERIDDYCDQRKLALRERLELFRKVCSAVSYAHQRLIIHRDLKPANIRVTPDGEPKLLDFGVAKLLDSPEAARFELTITMERVMTPEYASPEQVRGEQMTTATDVYSLGIILFELLTGIKPYRLKTRTAEELSRAIVEQEALRPSTAHNRKHAVPSEAHALRGDLDNIVLMAMRKEPERRYSSVAQFSDDIRRHLEGRAVLARGNSISYRTTKFIRRNRIGVAAAALILLSIVTGLVVAIAQARMTARQRDMAQRQQAKAERINSFLQRMLSFSNQSVTSVAPVAGGKRNATVNEMLDRIAPSIAQELADDAEVRGQVLQTIGSAYASQGYWDRAEENLRAALRAQIERFGEASPEAAETMSELGVLSYREVRLEEAARLLEGAIAIYQKKPGAYQNKLALAQDYLAVVYFYLGKRDEALKLDTDAFQLAISARPSDSNVITFIKGDYGGMLTFLGEVDKGEQLLREAIYDYRHNYSSPRWELGACLMLMGIAERGKGHVDEALRQLHEAEDLIRDTIGTTNGYYWNTLRQRAYILLAKRDLEGARAVAAELLNTSKTPGTQLAERYGEWLMADILTAEANHAEAERHYRTVLKLYTDSPQHLGQEIVPLQIALSKCLLAQNKVDEAEQLARAAYDASQRPAEAQMGKASAANLADLYIKSGRPQLARALQEAK